MFEALESNKVSFPFQVKGNIMKKRIFVVFAVVLTLVGCAVSRGPALDDNGLNRIERGVTTEYEIRQMFGEPTTITRDSRSSMKVLTYRYHNQDIKSQGAALLGAVAGGALGNQIGKGGGRALATFIGATAGGALSGNAVGNREQEQILKVVIDTRTGRVADYNFEQYQHRKDGIRFNRGVEVF